MSMTVLHYATNCEPVIIVVCSNAFIVAGAKERAKLSKYKCFLTKWQTTYTLKRHEICSCIYDIQVYKWFYWYYFKCSLLNLYLIAYFHSMERCLRNTDHYTDVFINEVGSLIRKSLIPCICMFHFHYNIYFGNIFC